MILLKSFDKATDYLDVTTKKIVSDIDGRKTVGWFKLLNGSISSLYVNKKQLIYQFDDQMIELTNHVSSVEKLDGDKKKFSLFYGNNLVHDFEYTFSDELLNVTPFEYIEIEDFDWGVFLSEVINNDNRKLRVINQKSELDNI